MNRQENQKTIYILLGILSVFVIWLALMVAGCYDEGIKLFELLDRLTVAMNNPTHITFNEYSLKAVLIFLFLYAMGIGVYFSSRENRRPGEEHGSARWGNVKSVVKRYMDKDSYKNIILSQNMRLGLNAKKHRRNLNVLVVGGSGAGKTRFYAKPNLMQCNTSFIVADPKGEMLRSIAPLLIENGYDIKVFNLIEPENSDGYNPFVYIRKDEDVIKLISNLIQNTTPKNAQQNDPFWEKSEIALDSALMLYLLHEAPPEEQTFEMLMFLIENAATVEDEDESGYQSPVDILFQGLEDEKPEHIAVRQYKIFKQASGVVCYKRLIYPSIEREIRAELSANAQEGAIKVFSSNLRQLLMQPPVKDTVTLGLDPGYAHGCKTAVVDATGKVLDTAIIYITPPKKDTERAKRILTGFIKKYGVTTISIGNGTASRETEQFTAELIKEIPQKVSYMVVSEAGASVYSASKLAAEEFPEYDVSLRSAVSIARRLQDPLAELVKIDPKAIGVGQYQHDMPKARMDEALKGVVEDCVNSVGVDLNTASYSLLSYISGINMTVAKNIVSYREENGAFTERKQLMKVPKLGAKAFEQCAGFLRVRGGKNPLDNTAVHPESYKAAQALIDRCGLSLADMGDVKQIAEKVNAMGMKKLATDIGIGAPTLKDIVGELEKPGRDPRDELPPPLMRSGDIMELKDLKPGMELMGTVRNVIDFGAFVDIGVHEDGLVHISQMCDRYIKHPLEVVKVGEVVKVWVLNVDLKKKRISLTMKKPKV